VDSTAIPSSFTFRVSSPNFSFALFFRLSLLKRRLFPSAAFHNNFCVSSASDNKFGNCKTLTSFGEGQWRRKPRVQRICACLAGVCLSYDLRGALGVAVSCWKDENLSPFLNPHKSRDHAYVTGPAIKCGNSPMLVLAVWSHPRVFLGVGSGGHISRSRHVNHSEFFFLMTQRSGVALSKRLFDAYMRWFVSSI
jgi:hypothetical protein